MVIARSSGTLGETDIRNDEGVPQGAILSPVLFNIFIDDLVNTLQTPKSTALAFADDIAVHTTDKMSLHSTIRAFEQWSRENGIAINKNKSAVMCIRVDRRTPMPRFNHVMGIPVAQEYKYLGVTLDDCGTVKSQTKGLNKRLGLFK